LPEAVKAIYVRRSAITFSVEAAHYVFTMVRRRGKRRVFTKGDVNRLIDSMLHPFMRGEQKVPVMVLDALAHAMVEQNPRESMVKFIRYTAPKLLEAAKSRRRNRTYRRKGKPS
jgi:hypothetical protein